MGEMNSTRGGLKERPECITEQLLTGSDQGFHFAPTDQNSEPHAIKVISSQDCPTARYDPAKWDFSKSHLFVSILPRFALRGQDGSAPTTSVSAQPTVWAAPRWPRCSAMSPWVVTGPDDQRVLFLSSRVSYIIFEPLCPPPVTAVPDRRRNGDRGKGDDKREKQRAHRHSDMAGITGAR